MSVTDAANATSAFQSFAQTRIPQEFGAEINLSKGSSSGRVSLLLTGGWYGPSDEFDGVIAPLLAKLPGDPATTTTSGPYIDSVRAFAGTQSIDTATGSDAHDTFYAKSLMVPESSPMSIEAITAFMDYLGDEGHSSAMVCYYRYA